MGPSAETLKHIAREIGLTPEEIVQRKKFLEFSDSDIELLREMHLYMEEKSVDDFFTEAFYRHLFSFPALHALLPNEATFQRLIAAQSKYFRRLTEGDYGDERVSGILCKRNSITAAASCHQTG